VPAFAAELVLDDRDLVWLAAGAGAALLLLAALAWHRRRGLVRRVTTAAVRLEDHQPAAEPRGLEKSLNRLERAVEQAVMRGGESSTAEGRMAQALAAIPQGVLICDETGEVVYRNERAAAYTAARHGDALVEGALDELLAAAVDGQGGTRTLELFGPPRRTLVLTTVPLDNGHRTTGALAVVDDVSDRRRLEAIRRDFVANISHELKTPVGALSLLAETLLSEDDPDIGRRLAARMQTEAMRVGRTIDDLLELSRIEAEEAPSREPVPVHLVIAEAVERVRPAAEQRGIEIHVTEPPRHLSILGHRRQVVSALYNLLENAVKYSDAGSAVEVGAATDGTWVDVQVADAGIGIPTRDLDRVFERFYRVDRARSRESGGTGLGLAIVRHVASNHGGRVSVASHEGEGSTFTLRLPGGPGAAAAPEAEAG
jgi:two-component system, OmpR family, sensor histidine kinase SenX3